MEGSREFNEFNVLSDKSSIEFAPLDFSSNDSNLSLRSGSVSRRYGVSAQRKYNVTLKMLDQSKFKEWHFVLIAWESFVSRQMVLSQLTSVEIIVLIAHATPDWTRLMAQHRTSLSQRE